MRLSLASAVHSICWLSLIGAASAQPAAILDLDQASIWNRSTPGVLDDPSAGDRFGAAVAFGDFNGDGYRDLAIGAPGDDNGALNDIGAVHVIYGTASGLDPDSPPDRLFVQGTGGLIGVPEDDDQLGRVLVTGDFNGDGFDDLAVGIPNESVGAIAGAGAVEVLYGTAQGLSVKGAQILRADAFDTTLSSLAWIAEPHTNDRFGISLAAVDLNGDGIDDLAIGADGKDVELAGGVVRSNAGLVYTALGYATGLWLGYHEEFAHFLYQEGFGEDSATGDAFGRTLAAGDFDHDGAGDLAIGAPLKDFAGWNDTGAVFVLYGIPDHSGIHRHSTFKRPAFGHPAPFVKVGDALAAGDLNGDSYDDLVVGASDESHPTGSGVVRWLFGGDGGMEKVSPNALVADGYALAGRTLTVGDFQGDGYDDIVLSWATGNFGPHGVRVVRGGAGGPSLLEADRLDIAPGSGAPMTPSNGFGQGLAAGDIDGDGVEELALGAPYDAPSGAQIGSVLLIPGKSPTIITPPPPEEDPGDEEGSCTPTGLQHCLAGGRFAVSVTYRTATGAHGSAHTIPAVADDSGLFWFFDPDNWEMLVKVLDACELNNHFWVYAAATTDVEYTLRVVDTYSDDVREYHNELGQAAQALADVEAFGVCGIAKVSARTPRLDAAGVSAWASPGMVAAAGAAGGACAPGNLVACLTAGRFEVRVDWAAPDGDHGAAKVVPFGSDDSGLFWFFDPDNWELLVKVLDGCALNGHYWVYAAATTTVEYTLTIRDTETGAVAVYRNPQGTLAAAITDTQAFDTCH